MRWDHFLLSRLWTDEVHPVPVSQPSLLEMREEIRRTMGQAVDEPFLKVDHRHVIFTLPEALWQIVESDPELYVNDMFEAAKAVIGNLFKDKFKLFPVEFGIIEIVHYTGRDMKFNPHIHMLVTEGGLSKKGIWCQHYFWPYGVMNTYWKYEVLTRFARHSKKSFEKRAIIDGQWKYRFNDGTNGFVVKNYRDVLNVKDFGRYLARYVRHPPIGESRILSFDGQQIGIKYEWDNQMFETSVSIENFISSILANIPPKGFNVVRQFGLYCNLHYRWALAKILGLRFTFTTLVTFAPGMIKNGLPCPNCKGRMEPALIEYIREGRRVEIVF